MLKANKTVALEDTLGTGLATFALPKLRELNLGSYHENILILKDLLYKRGSNNVLKRLF